MVTAAAVMTIRNEAIHLPHTVLRMIAEGLEVLVLDDGSSDGGPELLSGLVGNGLIGIHRRDNSGPMKLRTILEWEAEMIEELRHDWVVHVDADEWLQAYKPELRLIDLLSEADSRGATVVNFDEFVFTPIEELPPGADPRCHMLEYYFFEPSKPRLMRAWRRDADLDNRTHAGHRLEGERLSLFSSSGVLRHYPIVTVEHGIRKYRSRRYDPQELAKGWHRNRLPLIDGQPLRRPSNGKLRRLTRWDDRNFDRSAPSRYHFWEPQWGS